MTRRRLLKLVGRAAICWPLLAHAQQPPTIYRLGYLGLAQIPSSIEALQTGLRELGYVEARISRSNTDLLETNPKPSTRWPWNSCISVPTSSSPSARLQR